MSSQLRCTKRGRLGLSHGKAAAKRRVHLLLRAPHHAGAELALLALVQFFVPREGRAKFSTAGDPELREDGRGTGVSRSCGARGKAAGRSLGSFTLTATGQPSRTYTSITQARQDGNDARAWGGMHYPSTVVISDAEGEAIANS
jgi:hypothetical protein